MYKSKESRSPSYIIGLLLVVFILFMLAVGPYFGVQQLVLFALLPLFVLISLSVDIKTIHIRSKEIFFFLVFLILCLPTIYFYISFEDLQSDFFRLLAAVLAAYIPIGLNKNKNYEIFFHSGYIIGICALLLIEMLNNNLSAAASGARDRFFFNANYYSYISYFANFSLLYLHLKMRNKITLILSLTLPLLFLFLAFNTQSRSGLLLTIVVNLVFWFFIVKNEAKNPIVRIGKMIFLISAVIFMAFQFLEAYENSDIKRRISDKKDDSRAVLAKEGFRVFSENPITGVGLGQFVNYTVYDQFTHNSYAEVLSENGLIGALFLFFIFIMPTIKSLKIWLHDKKNEIKRLNSLFFLTFLLYNNAYVFYKFSFAMMFYFLIISLQNNLSTNSGPSNF